MSSAVNLILLQLKSSLTEKLITDIEEADPTRADNVKLGLLQEDKLRKNIQLGINSGDHDKPEELEGIFTLDKLPDIGFDLPAREIGGGQIWMRRGVVNIECFFIRQKLTEEQAFEQAHEVMSRLQSAIGSTSLTGIPRDSYGERPFGTMHCYASSFFESGGPPNSYIFRGKAYWACFTDKE